MGKYSKVINQLERAPEEESPYLERVRLTQAEFAAELGDNAEKLCEAYVAARDEKDALALQEKVVNIKIEALTRLIAQRFEDTGVESLKLKTGVSISVNPEPYAGVTDRDALREWCIENGLLRTLSMPYPSLNALAKERLLAGLPQPPGVKVYVNDRKITARGRKKEANEDDE